VRRVLRVEEETESGWDGNLCLRSRYAGWEIFPWVHAYLETIFYRSDRTRMAFENALLVFSVRTKPPSVSLTYLTQKGGALLQRSAIHNGPW
jgi:hypothetical protein